jgi:RNA recognition motif-containing protein
MSSPAIVYKDDAIYCSQHLTDRLSRIVRVLNLALGTSEEDVRAAFREFGKIQHCFVPLSAPTTAIVVFSTVTEAAAGVDGMDGAIADGKRIQVQRRTIAAQGGLSLLLIMS